VKQLVLRASAALVTVALLGTAAIAGGYLQTFDGAPPVPTSFRPLNNFDVAVHVNDNSFTPVNAGHGAGCEAPPAVHVVTRFEDAVYQCKDHLMTALWAHGYGVIYLTPNQLADFSGGETVIKLDVSTQRTSDRDWWDIWVTPYADHLELPLDAWLPDLNGEPRNAVHVRMDNFGTGTGFRGGVVRNFKVEDLPNAKIDPYESVLTTSASVRTGFEMHLTRTHVKFGIPSLNLWWLDSDFADLGWTSGVVQIGHHSYNPDKNGGANQPDTWHWDNIGISPSIPFTILESDRRAADATAPLLTFAAPAPANSNLRFNARGSNIQVSYNAGVTWQAAQRAAVVKPDQDEVFKSYWTPMPAGAATVLYRATDWWGGRWEIRDASIFSLAPSSIPAVPPTIAPTTAPTATPVQTVAPTLAPTVAPTTAPTAAATPVATRTATLPPVSTPVTSPTSAAATPSVKPSATAAPAPLIALPNPFSRSQPAAAPAPVQPGPEAYHASWVDQSAYPVLQPGESAEVTMHFRNTGTAPWVKGVTGEQANLGVYGDGIPYVYPSADAFNLAMAVDRGMGFSFDRAGAARALAAPAKVATLLSKNWPTDDRPAIQQEAVVAPGQVGTFNFTVRAPMQPGVYPLWLRPVVDGTVWMEDQGVYVLITSMPNHHAAWVSQSAYPTVKAGAVSTALSMVFRNTGSAPWVRGIEGSQANLGLVEEWQSWAAFAVAWPVKDRVAMQTEAVVQPGQVATFSFQVRAPAQPGTYLLRLRPVVDGSTWLEDAGAFMAITVVP
jgi:hypothetical protein